MQLEDRLAWRAPPSPVRRAGRVVSPPHNWTERGQYAITWAPRGDTRPNVLLPNSSPIPETSVEEPVAGIGEEPVPAAAAEQRVSLASPDTSIPGFR